MIFRWKCNVCDKEIESGSTRLKVIQLNPYKHDGDMCKKCWKEIKDKTKGDQHPRQTEGEDSNDLEEEK